MGKLSYDRGTTYTIGITYTNENGIAGQTAMFTIKTGQNDSDSTDGAAIFKQDASMSGGAATISITPSSIADSVSPGKYYYDVKVLDTSGAIYLIDSGRFTLEATPTNRLT
jgi:hypothetical protein